VQNFSEIGLSATELARVNYFKLAAVGHLGFSNKSVSGPLRTLQDLAVDARTKFGEDDIGFELMLLISKYWLTDIQPMPMTTVRTRGARWALSVYGYTPLQLRFRHVAPSVKCFHSRRILLLSS